MPRSKRTREWLRKFPEAKRVRREFLEDKACPECGRRNEFRIEVRTYVNLTDDGTENTDDCGNEWTSGSYCECNDCNFGGKVRDFTFPGLDDAIEARNEAQAN